MITRIRNRVAWFVLFTIVLAMFGFAMDAFHDRDLARQKRLEIQREMRESDAQQRAETMELSRRIDELSRRNSALQNYLDEERHVPR